MKAGDWAQQDGATLCALRSYARRCGLRSRSAQRREAWRFSSLSLTADGSGPPGVTILCDDAVAGAVGASRETPDNDKALAIEGANAPGLTWGGLAS
jgi:uncharacterized protein GlcG (DUF336 family)